MKKSKKGLSIAHLYAREMNIYGDTGNVQVLYSRLKWRGFDAEVTRVGIGEDLPERVDIIIGGGGQDSGQSLISADLVQKGSVLRELATDGVVMLMVCGMYQLFGREFVTAEGQVIQGVGVLPLSTRAGSDRMIGNTFYETAWGDVVGYENHSGRTNLDDKSTALGRVKRGSGNNGRDHTEGCLVNNVFGTYSHGPLLSKNPTLADELLLRAINRKYGINKLDQLDDSLELEAALRASRRPR